jgi:hypothetical protein
VAASALEWRQRRRSDLACIPPHRATVAVLMIAACSLAAKLLNAYFHFDFWTGDELNLCKTCVWTVHFLWMD